MFLKITIIAVIAVALVIAIGVGVACGIIGCLEGIEETYLD